MLSLIHQNWKTLWRNNQLVIFLLVLLAFVLRFVQLGNHSYWFDEGLEIKRALYPWPDLLLPEGPDPPLYRLILAVLVHFSREELILRMPSALFGAFSVYLIYGWLSLLGFARLGLITGAFLAIVPISIYYSQEVSQYSLVIFFTLLLLIAFERAGQRCYFQDWLVLWIVTMLALFTYYGLAFLLPILVTDLAWRIWQKRERTRLIGLSAYLAAVLAGIGILYILFLRVQLQSEMNASLKFGMPNDDWHRIFLDFSDMFFSRFLRFQVVLFSPQAPDSIPILFGVLMSIGCVLIFLRIPSLRRVPIIACGILISFYVASRLGYYHFGYRYGLPFLPFALLFQAIPVWQLTQRPKHLSAGIVLAILISFIYMAFGPQLGVHLNPWLELPREELRSVNEYLQKRAQPEDLIYVYYGAKPVYQVYQPLPENRTVYGVWLRDLPVNEKVSAVQNAINESTRVWLVFSHIHRNEYEEFVSGILQIDYTLEDEFVAQNAAAALFIKSLEEPVILNGN